MVEKLWLARHHYDQDRRLLFLKWEELVGCGSEYTADGNLVYRDWWVRNLKIEDLGKPTFGGRSLRMTILSPVLGISGIETEDSNPIRDLYRQFGTEPVAPAPENTVRLLIPSNGKWRRRPMQADLFAHLAFRTVAEPDNAFPLPHFNPFPSVVSYNGI